MRPGGCRSCFAGGFRFRLCMRLRASIGTPSEESMNRRCTKPLAGGGRSFETRTTALVRFARLKEKRLDGLVAHARHNISTGRLEGFNNKIKVTKRVGYGYRNEEYFFTLVRYLSILFIRNSSSRKTREALLFQYKSTMVAGMQKLQEEKEH